MLRLLRGCLIISVIALSGCKEDHPLISTFPLKNYNQHVNHWLKETDTNFDIPLMTHDTQQHKMEILNKHYFGTSSPWNNGYVNRILHSDNLQTAEEELIRSYSNRNKSYDEIQYGENFRRHSDDWLNDIYKNVNTKQFGQLTFHANNRAIALDNLSGRSLPTDDVSFYRHTLAGQGYPFDNLQISAIWVGTPLYILGETRDHAWSLVITPDFIAWVKTAGIARTNADFIKKWTDAAAKKLIAITRTKTSILDTLKTYRFSTYVGTLFPGIETPNGFKIMIPVIDNKHSASIGYATVAKNDAASMPLLATPRHFSGIMQTLIGRPYGWGNLYFYNDCSAELKSLFTPFGIWLPRHSSEQVYAGKMMDLSSESLKTRIQFLMDNGRPLSTLVYIDGHIFLFMGNYPNPNSSKHELIPMTFQNMWGLKPHPATRRAVIGQSVIFPLLAKYPEDPRLVSQAGKRHFQVSLLDEAANNLLKLEMIDLKDLMYP